MAQAGVRMRAWPASPLMGVVLMGGLLAGCASGPTSVDAALGAPTQKPALPTGPIARGALEVRTGQVAAPPPYPILPHDTCGASALAWLVGHPKTDIPIPVDLTRRRVACTACPVAPDVRLDRLNILFDAQTGRVARLTCG